MTQVVDDSLEAGRNAAGRRAWRDAYDLLRSADASGKLAGEDIESLAEAAWWTGRLEEAIAFRERAYAAYVEEDEKTRAAVLAVMLTMDHQVGGRCPSPAAGSRAQNVCSRTMMRAQRRDTSRSRGAFTLSTTAS
ncbi:MAG: hypothetical protein ACRDM8_08230 [Gaiellaceae bacterium]